jgi:hypothetical protein
LALAPSTVPLLRPLSTFICVIGGRSERHESCLMLGAGNV